MISYFQLTGRDGGRSRVNQANLRAAKHLKQYPNADRERVKKDFQHWVVRTVAYDRCRGRRGKNQRR